MDGQMSIFDFQEFLPDDMKTENRRIEEIIKHDILYLENFADVRDGIYEFFNKCTEKDERVDFLKKQYGNGAFKSKFGWVYYNENGFDVDINETGEKIKHLHYGYVVLANEIDRMMKSGQYSPTCKFKTKCSTYRVGCNGLTHWCDRYADVICEDAIKCDAFPIGCGGTIEICRYGGPYER